MPDALASALAWPGLGWIAAAGFLAGCVRGFSGFGAALVFLPVAGQFLPPIWALIVLTVMDAFGPLPNLPRAWRDGQPPDIARLVTGTALLLPVGLWFLDRMDPDLFRSLVSILALGMVACLATGLRYRGALRPPMVYGVGGCAGFLGGVAGLPGPPVILFYMASPLGAAAVRANTMLYLFAFDLLLIATLALRGALEAVPVLVGLLIVAPVMLGNLAGAAIFQPERERFYRRLAYGIIAASALLGLPLWDAG